MNSNAIKENIENLKNNIDQICSQCSRNQQNITIIGASKAKSSKDIIRAYKAGINNFGENYLQEALPKIKELNNIKIIWHFIGSIQKRKCKEIALNFDWVHTIDRIEIAQKLNEHRGTLSTKLNACIQINIDEEDSKSGINISDLEDFSDKLLPLNNIRLKGLMTLPKQTTDPTTQRNSFSKLSGALKKIKSNFPNASTLSMGMSNDYLIAIEEGSTIIRIGTNIFGKRQ